jgi:hypothetical protein
MDSIWKQLLSLATSHDGGPPSDDLKTASGAVLGALQRGDEEGTQALIDGLQGLPPHGAGWLAVLFGSHVEGGGQAERTGRPLLDLLRAWMQALPEDEEPVELSKRQLPGGGRPNADVLACARGESHESASDSVWWHYGDPRSPEANIAASIWGEAAVESIPLATSLAGSPPSSDGERVLLLWPKVLGSRSWDSGFFHPQIQQAPPNVEWVSSLSKKEARAWLDFLGCPRPKWRWFR